MIYTTGKIRPTLPLSHISQTAAPPPDAISWRWIGRQCICLIAFFYLPLLFSLEHVSVTENSMVLSLLCLGDRALAKLSPASLLVSPAHGKLSHRETTQWQTMPELKLKSQLNLIWHSLTEKNTVWYTSLGIPLNTNVNVRTDKQRIMSPAAQVPAIIDCLWQTRSLNAHSWVCHQLSPFLGLKTSNPQWKGHQQNVGLTSIYSLEAAAQVEIMAHTEFITAQLLPLDCFQREAKG